MSSGRVENNITACCLYMARNSYVVSMARMSLFWICVIVVIPYMYSLLRYFWVFESTQFVRLAYVGLFFHVCSSGVVLMGNARFVVVTCISYSHSSRKNVRAMGDLLQACCLSLERCSEPPYLAVVYLARPWYMLPSCPRSLRASSSC